MSSDAPIAVADGPTNEGESDGEARVASADHRWGGPLWRWFAGLLVSGGLVGGLVWWADPREIGALLTEAHVGAVIAAAALYLAVSLIRWVRLLGLVDPADRTVDLLWVSSGHSFANQILPARSGELAFPVLWTRATSRPVADGAVVLGAVRIVELGVVIPMFGVGLTVWLSAGGGWIPWLICGAGLGLLAGLPALMKLGLRTVEWGLTDTRLADVEFLASVRDMLPEAERAVERLGRRQQLWVVATTVLMWSAMFGVFYFTVAAFGSGLGLPQVVVGSAGGIVGNLVPLGGIGSLGTMDAGWVGAFEATGAPLEPIVAAGLLVHTVVIAASGLITAAAVGISRLVGSGSRPQDG